MHRSKLWGSKVSPLISLFPHPRHLSFLKPSLLPHTPPSFSHLLLTLLTALLTHTLTSYHTHTLSLSLSLALARAVGRDILWKPLNHRVLLVTRDNRKSVRIGAIKTLHKLFVEVTFYS